jgi:hypothetical protein
VEAGQTEPTDLAFGVVSKTGEREKGIVIFGFTLNGNYLSVSKYLFYSHKVKEV